MIKKVNVYSISLFVLCLTALCGCNASVSSAETESLPMTETQAQTDTAAVSQEAEGKAQRKTAVEKIFAMMFTYPNEEQISVVDTEELFAAEAKDSENHFYGALEDALKEYFTESAWSRFLYGTGTEYLVSAAVEQGTMTLETMEFLKQQDRSDEVKLTLEVNGEEMTPEFIVKYDLDGLVQSIEPTEKEQFEDAFDRQIAASEKSTK